MSEDILKLKNGYELCGSLVVYFVLKNSSMLCRTLSKLNLEWVNKICLQNKTKSTAYNALYGHNQKYEKEEYKISIYGHLLGKDSLYNSAGKPCEILNFNFCNSAKPSLNFISPQIQAGVVTVKFVDAVTAAVNFVLEEEMEAISEKRRKELRQLLDNLKSMIVEENVVELAITKLKKVNGNIADFPGLKEAIGNILKLLPVV
jgi:hypothetical protein